MSVIKVENVVRTSSSNGGSVSRKIDTSSIDKSLEEGKVKDELILNSSIGATASGEMISGESGFCEPVENIEESDIGQKIVGNGENTLSNIDSEIDVFSNSFVADGNDGNTLINNDMIQDNPSGDKKGISSTTVLIIVIVVCAIIGIGLGILAGKRSANK